MNMLRQINVGFQLSNANNSEGKIKCSSETKIVRDMEVSFLAPSMILNPPAVVIGICEEWFMTELVEASLGFLREILVLAIRV